MCRHKSIVEFKMLRSGNNDINVLMEGGFVSLCKVQIRFLGISSGVQALFLAFLLSSHPPSAYFSIGGKGNCKRSSELILS